MAEDIPAIEYVKSGEHLPPQLRDFHDTKLFFKWLVWEKLEQSRKECKEQGDTTSIRMLEGINFLNAQVFTIDYFLWFMGLYGYKLQRVRKKGVQFYNLDASMQSYDKELRDKQGTALRAALAQRTGGDSGITTAP